MSRFVIAPTLAAALLVAGPESSSRAVSTPATGKIAFVKELAPRLDDEIYVMNADGTGERRLTRSQATGIWKILEPPVWSPKGDRVAFVRVLIGDPSNTLYVVNVDGRELRRLTPPGARDSFPSWTPDGRKIVFARDFGSSADIYMTDAEGTELRRLTRSKALEFSPALSRDGTRVVFTRATANFDNLGTWVMDIGGDRARRLTRTTAGDLMWSPDGSQIVFTGEELASRVHVMDIRTGQSRRVTRGQPFAIESDPAWSPDGRSLAFASDQPVSGIDDIFVASGTGRGLRNLTRSDAHDSGPAWSPDGRRIAFVRGRASDQAGDIYVLNRDGSGLQRLTRNASSYAPAWRPSSRSG